MEQKTIRKIISGSEKYRGIPFWSWNNSLKVDELCKQIEEMKIVGLGGFIMHARMGLKDEYLGDKWFECIKACLDKAKELGMEAWIYDENGWPSGFVGGKLLENEDYCARYLEYQVGDFDENAFAVFAEDERCGFIRVEQPRKNVSEYHNIFLRISPAYTDILNATVVDAFIENTHELYYKYFEKSFGEELKGFFTDEPQYYRWGTPYTPCVEEIFEEKGKNVKDGLIWLFIQDERGYGFRSFYYESLNKLYVTNFYKKIYDWCQAHNVELTGHSVEENSLHDQMCGCADVMTSYEYENVPAIDCLGRYTLDEISPVQLSSVAEQLGKERVLTETFACCGYDVTPKELKGIAESQFFHGVNLMCHHLYPFSIAGQGKVDHPPVFGKHGNWFEQFKAFNEYFSRLGYIVGNTAANIDVAILHPMREVWLDYLRSDEVGSVKEVEKVFYDLLLTLRKHGVKYHFIDETILGRHGKLSGNKLVVGKCEYSAIIVPPIRTISKTSLDILSNYNGKLCVINDLKYVDGVSKDISLRGNVTLEDIINSVSIKYYCEDGNSFTTSRSGDIGDYIFIKNLSMSERSAVQLKNVAENYVSLDLLTFARKPISNLIELGANESIILVKSDSATPCVYEEKQLDVTKNFTTVDITDNYLVLDYAQISKDGVSYGEKLPVIQHFENLLREDYRGELFVKQQFVVNDLTDAKIVLEKSHFTSITLNGERLRLTQSDFDVYFVESDISGKIKRGVNELNYSFDFWQHEGVHYALFDPDARESLRNCLYYDTSIESAYIKGKFIVNDDLSISSMTKLPEISSKLNERGYTFFKGCQTLVGNIEWNGEDEVELKLDGRFLVAELTINDRRTDMVLDTKLDITPYLKSGRNEIKIKLRSSLRNLFGPHHFICDGDVTGVGPYHFNMRGQWENGEPNSFTHEYKTVPFGVDKITLVMCKRR